MSKKICISFFSGFNCKNSISFNKIYKTIGIENARKS